MTKKKFGMAEVLSVAEQGFCTGVFLLSLQVPGEIDFDPRPGQFVVLRPAHPSSKMGRAFSVVNYVGRRLELLIKVVGNNTEYYSKLTPKKKIHLTGPLGRELDTGSDSYVLVAGGVGAAALTLLAEELVRLGKHVTVYLGAKNKKQIVASDYFSRCSIVPMIICEEGICEKTGQVTDHLEDSLVKDKGASTIIACGPKGMLHAVHKLAVAHGNKCEVMLEEVMACGVGSCKGCAVFGVDGSVKSICQDGPAIDSRYIDWPKFVGPIKIELPDKRVKKEKALESLFCGRVFEYPSTNASGCLSVDAIENGLFDISCMSALVTKGLKVQDTAGNPMPRICEVSGGMGNSIGLQNIGIKRFLAEELLRWLVTGKMIIVNISGNTVEEFVCLTEDLDDTDVIALEVNVSCPNLKKHGAAFGTDPSMTARVTEAVRKASSKTIIVKLSPNVTDIVSIAKSAVDAGADAISLINTLYVKSIDPMTRRPKIAMGGYGLSGPPIKGLAVRMVNQVYDAVKVPIIGMGGVEDGMDAAEMMMAGASLVAVGTAGFSNPSVHNEIANTLEGMVSHHGYSCIGEMVGDELK